VQHAVRQAQQLLAYMSTGAQSPAPWHAPWPTSSKKPSKQCSWFTLPTRQTYKCTWKASQLQLCLLPGRGTSRPASASLQLFPRYVLLSLHWTSTALPAALLAASTARSLKYACSCLLICVCACCLPGPASAACMHLLLPTVLCCGCCACACCCVNNLHHCHGAELPSTQPAAATA
jgi:hypothetical protein